MSAATAFRWSWGLPAVTVLASFPPLAGAIQRFGANLLRLQRHVPAGGLVRASISQAYGADSHFVGRADRALDQGHFI